MPAAVAPVRGSYLGLGSGHWISDKIDRGTYILLEDRSLWEIDSFDRLDTNLWLRLDNITVVTDSQCLRGYRLINTDDRTKACAKFVAYSR